MGNEQTQCVSMHGSLKRRAIRPRCRPIGLRSLQNDYTHVIYRPIVPLQIDEEQGSRRQEHAGPGRPAQLFAPDPRA